MKTIDLLPDLEACWMSMLVMLYVRKSDGAMLMPLPMAAELMVMRLVDK